MAGMNELAALVRELEDQLVVCIRCGMCQAVCPLYEQTRKESDVARGKLALLDGLMKNLFADAAGVDKRLNQCLLCGSCAANCPSGVNVIDIFIKARAILARYQGLSPAKKVVFRKMLAHPATFDRLTEWAGRFQNLFVRDERNTQGTSCARLVSPLINDRHFFPLARVPFRKDPSRKDVKPGQSGITALFFTGCLVDKFFPNIGRSALAVFRYHGIGAIVPEGQGCCGIPALASGDTQTFEALVEHNVRLFRDRSYDYLVTACATCTSTIRKLWPAMVRGKGSALQETVSEISEKTLDINQFLVDIIRPAAWKAAPAMGRGTVTYHDPCHLKKSLGVAEQPREILRQAGYSLAEMEGSDKCCGMGGSFNIYHYDLSSRIGTLKADTIVNTGCSTVATGCPACMMQISDMLAAHGADVAVRHPIELYAQSL